VITLLLVLLAANFLAQIFLLAGLLMLFGKLFRTERPAFKSALKVAALITVVGLVVSLPVSLLMRSASSGTAIALGLAAMVGIYVFYWKMIRKLLQSSGKKTFGAMVFSLGISTAVALGLAYTLRGYGFEAFVVPTGAMAPTIFGAHRDVVCPNCGRQFAVSMSDTLTASGEFRMQLPPSKQAKCINCAQEFEVLLDEIASGDRLIVDKFTTPKRWDVVVFRIPKESTNYVKRYVGLPGETLDIADGDVFINQDRVAKQPNEQLDLWFPVHDTQLMPKTIDADTPRWEPATKENWIAAGTGWKFNGADKDVAGKDEADLQFHGTIDDRLDYNANIAEMGIVAPTLHNVCDVRILCDVQQFSGDGAGSIVWEFNGGVVQCVIHATGDVELICEWPQSGTEAQRAAGTLSGELKSPRQIALAIRDGFAYVLDGDRICASLQIAPLKRLDVPLRMLVNSGKAAIRAGHCDLTIGRIQLARDIYYLAPERNIPDAVRLPISLKPDEIFFLGDNSAQSRDSRYMGPSMTRDFIGVTRAIYWPVSRWRNFP
jgi:signal peptidase I